MAAAIASRGFSVIGVDVDQEVVAAINSGRAPVPETGLEELIAQNRDRLKATLSHHEAVGAADISFVIVPTPTDSRGAFSLQYVEWAAQEIGKALADRQDYHLVVLVSTVLPGSTRYQVLPELERASGKKCGPDFGLCYSPDFIALGSIIRDYLNPDFNLVGEFDRRSGDLLERSYRELMENRPPCKRMSLENAELAKLALNTFVTTKISYANMLAELCERIPGGDVDVVTDAIGCDRRIGKAYLKGAIGYGGPCFPRDNVALSFLAEALGISAPIAEATHAFNVGFVERFIQRTAPHVSPGETAAVLGLAYKPQTHVVEESQGIELALALSRKGVRVLGFDPLGTAEARARVRDHVLVLDSMEECVEQASWVFVTTPDPAFDSLPDLLSGRQGVAVVDFWRRYRGIPSRCPGVTYIPVGAGSSGGEAADRLRRIWNVEGGL